MSTYNAAIKKAFTKFTGEEPEFTVPLPPTASNRLYFRLSGGNTSVIACYNPDRTENEAFLYITERLQKAGVKVPEIYYHDLDNHFYLQQDLGDVKLIDLVEEYRRNDNDEYIDWYRWVINSMPAIQYTASRDFDFSKCFPRESFDLQSILWDLNYFKYYFLKLMHIPFHEQKLEDDFHVLTDFLLKAPSGFFLFRDFQSRNIMIVENDIYFIDYQGGRRGSLQYDLASLLYEAKIALTSEQRNALLEHYLDVYSTFSFFDRSEFLKFYPAFVLIRMLQAFGAYGYRGYFERKSFFLRSVPGALQNLKYHLENSELGVKIPHLRDALNEMVSSTSFVIPETRYDKMTVSISSFAFKSGIPADFSGHGGGFVFDCRALPNPGRYDEYRDLTGKDDAVIQFMDSKSEVLNFIRRSAELAASSVRNYLERGHEHLMISFGCTGGQHRSVYCAEKLAESLRKEFDITISLNHLGLEKDSDD